MRNKIAVTLILFIFGFMQGAIADEHPSEHPTGGSQPGTEHPSGDAASQQAPSAETPKNEQKETKKKSDKKKKKNKNAADPTSWNREAVEKDLLTYIDREKTNGFFIVKDGVQGTERKLTLDRVHTDKIVKLVDGTSFVCADFKDTSGEKVDVDFFMTSDSSSGAVNVNKVQVHKVNGSPRYTYVQRNGAWFQEAVN